jgi:hypothetical protein
LEINGFFLFGFDKNDRATIDARELVVLQKIAAALLALDATALDHSVMEGGTEGDMH